MFNTMKTKILSISNSSRRLSIKDQMEKNNISFDFFDAITPNDFILKQEDNITKVILKDSTYFIDSKVVNPIINRNYMRVGEIACAISHIKICESLLNFNEDDHYLVLEDDTICLKDIEKIYLLDDYIKNNVDKQDLIYLLNYSPSFQQRKSWYYNLCDKVTEHFYILKNNPSIFLEATNSFVINKNFCKKYLQIIKSIGLIGPADSALIHLFANNHITVSITDLDYFSPIFENNPSYVHETEKILM